MDWKRPYPIIIHPFLQYLGFSGVAPVTRFCRGVINLSWPSPNGPSKGKQGYIWESGKSIGFPITYGFWCDKDLLLSAFQKGDFILLSWWLPPSTFLLIPGPMSMSSTSTSSVLVWLFNIDRGWIQCFQGSPFMTPLVRPHPRGLAASQVVGRGDAHPVSREALLVRCQGQPRSMTVHPTGDARYERPLFLVDDDLPAVWVWTAGCLWFNP